MNLKKELFFFIPWALLDPNWLFLSSLFAKRPFFFAVRTMCYSSRKDSSITVLCSSSFILFHLKGFRLGMIQWASIMSVKL